MKRMFCVHINTITTYLTIIIKDKDLEVLIQIGRTRYPWLISS